LDKHLTYEDMLKICEKINKYYLPDEQPFYEMIDHILENAENKRADEVILETFKTLLKLIDSQIKEIETKVNIRATCLKGCAYCCYFPIITTRLEAKLILQYIQRLPEEQKQDILGHLMNYFETNKERLEKVCSIDFHEDPQFKIKYISEQVSCPFLDQSSNTCKVYDVRPTPCRTYLNYCHPNVCAHSLMPRETFSYEFLHEFYMMALNEIIQEFLYEDENLGITFPEDVFHIDYLPKLLKEELLK
jgi:uncharacterized protein